MSEQTPKTSTPSIKRGEPEPLTIVPTIPFGQMNVGEYVELEIENNAMYTAVQKRIWRHMKKFPDTKWAIRSVGPRKAPYTIRVYRVEPDHGTS